MEPVTHFLTGTVLGRAGLNRKTAYATLAATLAAEAPDLDVVWSFGGPVAGLEHHRGITHTFVAVPFLAALVCGFVWLLDRWWLGKGRTGIPVRWVWVWFAAVVALLSHLLLDWTNNYGIRPFFPFNSRWYEGSFVFIAEPVLWGLLILALGMPWLLGLADGEIGVKRRISGEAPRGQAWALFALVGMVLLWGLRWVEHEQALALARQAAITADTSRESVLRMAAEPYPVNPFRWHVIAETAHTFQLAEVDCLQGLVTPDEHVLHKPKVTDAVTVAKQGWLGRVYLDWASPEGGGWPVVTDLGPVVVPADASGIGPGVAPPRAWTTVEFRDLRFEYSVLDSLRPEGGKPVIGGWVYVVDGREEAGEFMGNREQR